MEHQMFQRWLEKQRKMGCQQSALPTTETCLEQSIFLMRLKKKDKNQLSVVRFILPAEVDLKKPEKKTEVEIT
jgi:hypothetical protein